MDTTTTPLSEREKALKLCDTAHASAKDLAAALDRTRAAIANCTSDGLIRRATRWIEQTKAYPMHDGVLARKLNAVCDQMEAGDSERNPSQTDSSLASPAGGEGAKTARKTAK